MSNHSLLKKRGSSISNSERRVSWGSDNVLEFFKNETPSKISSASAEASQLEPQPYSPISNLPLTPIHHHKEPVVNLSTVSEEEDNNLNTSQTSPFNSQTSLSTIFPELEPCILESLNWKLPTRQRNVNKTPKKNLKTQRRIEELRNVLGDKTTEWQDLADQVESFKELAVKTKAELAESAYLKKQWVEQYNQEKVEADGRFALMIRDFGDFGGFGGFGNRGAEEGDRWEVIKDSNVKVFRFRGMIDEVAELSNLVLLVSHSSVEFELVDEFKDKDVMRVWAGFRDFMEVQTFGSQNEMLREFGVLWTYFCRFGQSFGRLKRVVLVCDLHCTTEFCIISVDLLGHQSRINVNFHNIIKEWDVLSRLSI